MISTDELSSGLVGSKLSTITEIEIEEKTVSYASSESGTKTVSKPDGTVAWTVAENTSTNRSLHFDEDGSEVNLKNEGGKTLTVKYDNTESNSRTIRITFFKVS